MAKAKVTWNMVIQKDPRGLHLKKEDSVVCNKRRRSLCDNQTDCNDNRQVSKFIKVINVFNETVIISSVLF